MNLYVINTFYSIFMQVVGNALGASLGCNKDVSISHGSGVLNYYQIRHRNFPYEFD